MNREQLRALAQETVDISRAGRYQIGNRVVMFDAARPTELWTAEDLDRLVAETQLPQEGPAPVYKVRGEGTVDTIFRLAGGETICHEIGVLNFASAKNPGGGVFRNDPEDVARFWQELLAEEGWGRLFQSVTFSILERPDRDSNIAPFRQRF